MGTTQIAIRLDDELLERLDWLVARCDYDSRADVLRAALQRLLRDERERHIDQIYADAYRRIPPTREELDWAARPVGFPGLSDDDWGDWF